jgi:AraC-like DNA-binding protein
MYCNKSQPSVQKYVVLMRCKSNLNDIILFNNYHSERGNDMDSETGFFSALEGLIFIADNYWNNFRIESSGLWSKKQWNSSGGRMKYFEISYITGGSSVLQMNRRKYSAAKGHIYFSDLSEFSSCVSADLQLYYITFGIDDEDIYRKVKSCYVKLADCVQSSGLTGMEELFAAFHYENTMNKFNARLLVRNIFIEILTVLYRHLESGRGNDANNAACSRCRNTISNIVWHLDGNYAAAISLGDLGELYSMDPRYLNSIFKKQMGITIMKYLVRLRIEKSKRLLGFTTMSITDIALDTGFCDCQHFCKVFRRIEGVTPREFRNGLIRSNAKVYPPHEAPAIMT